MHLLNLSYLPWIEKRLKRNQAIFVHLLGTPGSPFTSATFLNPPAVEATPARKYFASPRLETLTSGEVAGRPYRVVQPYYSLPAWYLGPLQSAWARSVHRQVHALTSLDQPYLLWANCAGPLHSALFDVLAPGAAFRVFDSSDDFTAWEPPDYQQRLARMLTRTDLALAVNAHVASRLPHPHPQVFRNCTDFDNFYSWQGEFHLPPLFPKPPGSRYIGFVGGLNQTRVDEPLLVHLLTRFPDWRFVFAGYTDNQEFLSRVLARPNAHYIPEIPYTSLPGFIKSCDACIIPHLDNAVTRGNDLLKVLDYLASGVPVVSTRCSGIEEFASVVTIRETHEEFALALETAVAQRAHHDPDPGYEAARRRDWSRQVPKLTALLPMPLEVLSAAPSVQQSYPC